MAIDEISKKLKDFKMILDSPTPEIVKLQLILQGAVSATVNAGPIAYVNGFLKADVRSKSPKPLADALETVFKDFLVVCEQALEVHGRLITEVQIPLHQLMMKNFETLTKTINEILNVEPKQEFQTIEASI